MSNYSISTVLRVVLIVIVVAVVFYVAIKMFGFKIGLPLPEKGEKMRLMSYLSCALARCTRGCGSDLVSTIKLEENKWCKDTCSGNEYLCGKENALSIILNESVVLKGWHPVSLLEDNDLRTYFDWGSGKFLDSQCFKYYCSWSNVAGALVSDGGIGCGEKTGNDCQGNIWLPWEYASDFCSEGKESGGFIWYKSCLFTKDTEFRIWADKNPSPLYKCHRVFVCPE